MKSNILVIGSFVLVDIIDNKSKLVSIFFQERLGMMLEEKDYIFKRRKYKKFYKVLKNNKLKEYQIHRIFNDFITLTHLLNLGIIPSSKGVGNEITRKIKDLHTFLRYYCDFKSEDMNSLYLTFLNIYKLPRTFNEVILKKFLMIEKNYRIFEKKFRNNIKEADYRIYYETYGIPKEYFGKKETLSITNYNFD